MLTPQEFADAVKKVPIVAVDFVIENGSGEILLGKRENNPAKGFYFTFGGAILKDEKIGQAIERVSINELSYKLQPALLSMFNVFEFFYPNNFLNNSDFTTHYILLSYHYKDLENRIAPFLTYREGGYFKQHSDFIWLNPDALIASSAVHNDCKSIIKTFCEKTIKKDGMYD
jgi:colanic acid biosynthesis protein WcaH